MKCNLFIIAPAQRDVFEKAGSTSENYRRLSLHIKRALLFSRSGFTILLNEIPGGLRRKKFFIITWRKVKLY